MIRREGRWPVVQMKWRLEASLRSALQRADAKRAAGGNQHAAARDRQRQKIVAGIQKPGSGMLIRIIDRIRTNTIPTRCRARRRWRGRPRAAGDRRSTWRSSRRGRRGSDLARAARHHERQQRVDADDRQQQRHAAHRRQRRRRRRPGTRVRPIRRPRAGRMSFKLQIRIDVGHRHLKRRGPVSSDLRPCASRGENSLSLPAGVSVPQANAGSPTLSPRSGTTPTILSHYRFSALTDRVLPSMRRRRPIGLRPPRNLRTNGSLTTVTGAAPSR